MAYLKYAWAREQRFLLTPEIWSILSFMLGVALDSYNFILVKNYNHIDLHLIHAIGAKTKLEYCNSLFYKKKIYFQTFKHHIFFGITISRKKEIFWNLVYFPFFSLILAYFFKNIASLICNCPFKKNKDEHICNSSFPPISYSTDGQKEGFIKV